MDRESVINASYEPLHLHAQVRIHNLNIRGVLARPALPIEMASIGRQYMPSVFLTGTPDIA